jgi:hypothetical protein
MTDAHEIIFEPSRIGFDRYLNIVATGMVKYSIMYGKSSEALMSLSNVLIRLCRTIKLLVCTSL